MLFKDATPVRKKQNAARRIRFSGISTQVTFLTNIIISQIRLVTDDISNERIVFLKSVPICFNYGCDALWMMQVTIRNARSVDVSLVLLR